MKGFDRVAFIYDELARLAFGDTLVKAQEHYLSEIKDGDRVLILGGGTGWILDSIFEVVIPGEIWFIDASAKMMERAKARNSDLCIVHFIHGTEERIPEDREFDVAITNFFLDIFSEEKLPAVVGKIKKSMTQNSIWLCSDFVDTGKWYHRILLKSMYLFFRIVAGLKNKSLPKWEGSLVKWGFVKAREKIFRDGFVKSVVFTCK